MEGILGTHCDDFDDHDESSIDISCHTVIQDTYLGSYPGNGCRIGLKFDSFLQEYIQSSRSFTNCEKGIF